MKSTKIFSLTLSTLFIVFVVSVVAVSAQDAPAGGVATGTGGAGAGTSGSGSGSGSNAAVGTGTTSTTQNQTKTTTTATTNSQLNERVAKRKAELKTTLTTAQQKRMQGRCKNAQKVLSTTNERAKIVQTNRDKIHANLLERLTNLESKLKADGVDTTELNAQLAILKTQIDTFKADTDAYLLAAGDTATLDCQTDPVAFKASLEASRAALKKVHTDAVAIRNTLAQGIKPLLVSLKTKVAAEAN